MLNSTTGYRLRQKLLAMGQPILLEQQQVRKAPVEQVIGSIEESGQTMVLMHLMLD